jgi:hypothetical protein
VKKNEAQMRQNLKKKMDAKFASNLLAKQPIGGLPPFGLIFQNQLQVVPENLQVFYPILQVHFQVNLQVNVKVRYS